MYTEEAQRISKEYRKKQLLCFSHLFYKYILPLIPTSCAFSLLCFRATAKNLFKNSHSMLNKEV